HLRRWPAGHLQWRRRAPARPGDARASTIARDRLAGRGIHLRRPSAPTTAIAGGAARGVGARTGTWRGGGHPRLRGGARAIAAVPGRQVAGRWAAAPRP